MAAVCKIKNVNVHVYEKQYSGSYKRISAFDTSKQPETRPIVRVLYCGGVHFGKFISFFMIFIFIVHYSIVFVLYVDALSV